MDNFKIRPDAQIAVTQKCEACDGQGVTGVESRCRQCGHLYTEADFAAERAADEQARMNNPQGIAETQLCGCDWSYREERDTYCAECDGDGEQCLNVTLTDLAQALAGLLPDVIRHAPGSRSM